MFEIGPALREARERQRLSYSQVEEDTKIRSRYIRALEEEDFGVLPGPTYSKGFLRAYADYLGLDGQLFVDEFATRHHDPRADGEREVYPRARAKQQHRHRRESSIVLIALAAIVLISALVFLGSTTDNPPATIPVPPPSTSSTPASTKAQSTPTSTATKKHHTAHGQTFTVAITASGDCWMTANVGSKTGPAAKTVKGTDLASYKLLAGVTAQIKSTKPLYITFGAPGNISGVTINGHTAHLPYVSSGQALKVTASGVTAA